MELKSFQVDAFTDKIFGGNPACVVPLEQWLPDDLLLQIAKENAVAETAFFIEKENGYHLRWFTPELEMDLCGHATLATAHVLKQHLGYKGDSIQFYSLSGILKVTIQPDLYILDFPSRKPQKAELPEIITRSLNIQPKEILKSRDYFLVYESEEEVKQLKPDRELLSNLSLGPGGIIVTAQGKEVDFVSRFFIPQASIFEDPVTGSAHCSLIPFWSERLNKDEMSALQLSERVGKLFCTNQADRVLIAGQARTYSIGSIWIE